MGRRRRGRAFRGFEAALALSPPNPSPPPSRYPVPARRHRVEETIRRSRFITTVDRAAGVEDAHAFVAEIAAEFPDATHACWAFAVGPPGSTTHVGMSDAGEPQGTAGRPMLTALLHGGVGEIAAVVTRYYGGVNLGKGGLGRAYSGGVRQALESLPLAEKLNRVEFELEVGYPSVDPVLRLLDEVEATRIEEEFGARVRLRVAVPEDRLESFERRFAEETAGTGVIRRGDEEG